jgi:hypothetical protein
LWKVRKSSATPPWGRSGGIEEIIAEEIIIEVPLSEREEREIIKDRESLYKR